MMKLFGFTLNTSFSLRYDRGGWTPKCGELILVSNSYSDSDTWSKRIFMGKSHGYAWCLTREATKEYVDLGRIMPSKHFTVSRWKRYRELNTKG